MIYSVLLIYSVNKFDKMKNLEDTSFQQSIQTNFIPMDEALSLKDIQFNFMFGLSSNDFKIHESDYDDLEDYVQWDV